MEQNKIVLKTPEGMHYTLSAVKNGEQILRLVPNSPAPSSGKKGISKVAEQDKYFTKITAEDRKKVKYWLINLERRYWGHSFLGRVREALRVVNYDYWIANLEPSVANGKIYYAEGNDVGVGFVDSKWKQMAKEYDPERGSRMATLHELFLWYALRIANGLWTLHYVESNSNTAGNYWSAPGAAGAIEKTGARECGGYRDGQGNSKKIVTYKSECAQVGGYWLDDGTTWPVARVLYPGDDQTWAAHPDHYTGVLVLTK